MCADCSQPRLLPASHRAAGAFLLCRSQWEYAPSGVPSGLRYSDCMTLLRLRAADIGETEDTLAAVMAELQEIEWAFRQGSVEALRTQREPPDGR